MNEAHERCGSDEWRQMIREVILPWALGETDLGDDVLEVGPGYGATTDVLSESVPRASDSLASEELEAHHDGDTYNPVDPSTLPARWRQPGSPM